jgi:hypothetical protein
VSSAEGASPALDARHLLALWDQIQVELAVKYPGIAPLLRDVTPAADKHAPNTFVLAVATDFYYRQLRSTKNLEPLLEVVREVTGAPWKCRVIRAVAATLPAEPGAANGAGLPTKTPPPEDGAQPGGEVPPAEAAAGQRLSGSGIVQKTLDLFGGRLV